MNNKIDLFKVLSTHERQPIIRDYDHPPPLPVTPVVAIVNRPVAAAVAVTATASATTTATVENTEPELHYHSTDILELHRDSRPAEASSSNSKSSDEADELIEHIERFPDNAQGSPYAQRKLGHLSSFRNATATPPFAAKNDDDIVMVEDHYNTSRTNTSSDTLNSEDFSSFTSDEIQNLKKNGATAI